MARLGGRKAAIGGRRRKGRLGVSVSSLPRGKGGRKGRVAARVY